MKILVDENIPAQTVKELETSGHDVLDIRGTNKEGITDDELWQLALTEKRLLITTDKGFAQNRNLSHYGILIVTLKQPSQQQIHNRILKALNQHPVQEWPGSLIVIKDTVQSIWKRK